MKKNQILNLHEPSFNNAEKKYLFECIKSGYVSSVGKYVNIFEKKLAKFVKSKYCVSCVNGTSALHLALKTIGVQRNHEVIVPTITFVAPINSVIYNEASPIFFDCDNFLNINVSDVIEFIKNKTYFKNNKTYNKKNNKIIKAIIIVHVFGNAVYMDDLVKICKKRKIKIVEDASESLGTYFKSGKYKGMHTGTVGDVGCISFNGNKIITTGGGGAIITNSIKISKEFYYLSTQAKDDNIFFIHNKIGYNYRMSNLNAAIGIAQLQKIKNYLKLKKNIHKLYNLSMKKFSNIELLQNPSYSNSNNWLNAIFVLDENKSSFKKIFNNLLNNNINVRPVWFPNHLQKPFKKYQKYKIKNANIIYNQVICLPSSSFLTKKNIYKIEKNLQL